MEGHRWTELSSASQGHGCREGLAGPSPASHGDSVSPTQIPVSRRRGGSELPISGSKQAKWKVWDVPVPPGAGFS